MSQHALELAAALQAIADKDRYRITSGSPGPLYTSGWLAAVAYFSEVAREALVAYLASDEHAEDVERARAGAAGFQGLAKGAAPSDTAHPEGEMLTDQHARAIADLELLRDRWDMDCSMGEACDMDAEWVRKAEWRYKRVQAAIDLLRQDAPPEPTPPSRPQGEEGLWRPISEAPKGRKVLAGYANELGNWRTILACYYPAGTLEAGESLDTEDGSAPAGWYEESETHDEILPCAEPAAWQPLPAPPAISNQGKPSS